MSMLNDLFIVPATLSGQQRNFLTCLAKLPDIKSAHGDPVLDCDRALAEEAAELLTNNEGSTDG